MGCCSATSAFDHTHVAVRFEPSSFDGYLCSSEQSKPVFDKNSVDGSDNIAFWASPDSGGLADINAAQLSSLHQSKYNMRTSNCPAHTQAYGWLTGQIKLIPSDGLGSPDVCDPNLMAFSDKIDKSYDMEYAVNVRSSLKDMSTNGVLIGPSRLPCYMWQGNPADPSGYAALRTALNCDGVAPTTIAAAYPTIPDIVNETSIKAQMEAIVAGPEVDPYSEKNKQVVQLLQGLGWQHLSFAFKEAYEAFPESFSDDTFCTEYDGPNLPDLMNNTFPPLPDTVCISADKSKETLWMTDPATIYNNNFFMASFASSGVAFVTAAKRAGFGGAAQRHFTAEDCPGEVALASPYLCPTFDPYPASRVRKLAVI
jgi:hypothetical protein